jgi:hypothetical protein
MSRQLTLANLSSPQEAHFVAELFRLGGPQHAAEAALRAGYADTAEGAERAAAFLLGSSRISRVITGEIKVRFDTAAAAAYATLLEVCSNKNAPANARITAATEILNRSSIGPVPSRSIAVSARVGVEELLEQLDAREKEQSTIDSERATERDDDLHTLPPAVTPCCASVGLQLKSD